MRTRLLAIYLVLVLAPLAALGWLGAELVRREQAVVALRFQEVLGATLGGVAVQIAGFMDERAREIMRDRELSQLSPDELRQRTHTSPIVSQYVVLDPQGALVYPSPLMPISPSEEAFLERTWSVWADQAIPVPDPKTQAMAVPEGHAAAQQQGWHASHWGSGLRVMYWWRSDDGRTVAAELNEARLKADIIARLPEAWPGMPPEESPLPDGRIELAGADGQVLYAWGGYTPSADQAPLAERPLDPPLAAWRLRYYGDAAVSAGPGMWFNFGAGLVAALAAFLGLAIYAYREQTRAIREAVQRVSFVNQVSHELKAPLTNIRMYAEVLDEELADADPAVRKRIDVIVSECQRLSRLILNVLTFSRDERAALRVHPAPGDFAAAIRDVVGRVAPGLAAQGIETTCAGPESSPRAFDRDVLEQILGNLLNNVEKYAHEAGQVQIHWSFDGGRAVVDIKDDGPGIPAAARRRVFDPFYRVSNRLTDGVAGVGLGLTIARRLAHVHGGNLTLEPSARGAHFRLALIAPEVNEDPAS